MSAAAPLKKRVAILISGRGSNMMALVEAARAPDFPAEVAAVISNRPDAAGLDWAREQGLKSVALDHKTFSGRPAFEAALQGELDDVGVEIIALAGFMRLLTADFVTRWQGRMINVHPALLPSFPGLDTHARALAAGCRIAGCTVHFVVPEMDAGPITSQAAIGISDDDTEDTLAARVLAAEHRLYPAALAALAAGDLLIDGDRVRSRGLLARGGDSRGTGEMIVSGPHLPRNDV